MKTSTKLLLGAAALGAGYLAWRRFGPSSSSSSPTSLIPTPVKVDPSPVALRGGKTGFQRNHRS